MKKRSGGSAIVLNINSQHIILDLIKSLKSLVDETIVGVDSKTIDKTYNPSSTVRTEY